MATEYKYDVFISYSRKDYVDDNKNVISGNIISQIKEALKDAGITYWMDEEGIYSGDEFAKIIAKFIRQSKIFLFVSTENSNASEWTSDEIATARMYKKKIIPFKYDDSFYNEGVIMFIAKLDYVEYQSNPERALEKLVSSIKKYLAELEDLRKREEELQLKKKQEEEERKKRAEEEARKEKVRDEIKQKAQDCQHLIIQQQAIVQQLYTKNISIGNQTKECPVCKKASSIEASFCDRCGFMFPTLYSIDGNENYPFDNKHLIVAKANYDAIAYIEKEKMDLERRINELTASLDKISRECEQHIKTIQDKADEADKYSKKAQMLSSENEQLQKEVKTTKDNLVLLTSQNEQLKQSLFIVSKECNETRKEKESEAKFFKEKNTELAKSENYYKKTANLLETQKQELEQKIASLEKELSERKKLCEQSEQKRNQLQKMVKGLEGKSASTEPLTLYDVFLLSINSNYKLEVVKLIHDLTNIGLKESNDLVDGCPSKILSSIYKEKALEIRGLFKAVDAKVVLRQSVVEDGDDSHSTQNDHKKITSSKEAQELILQCRIDPYRKILANNQIIQTINVEQLKKELEHYGVYMSIYEIKSFKTIEKLKKAIIKKSSISITQQ